MSLCAPEYSTNYQRLFISRFLAFLVPPPGIRHQPPDRLLSKSISMLGFGLLASSNPVAKLKGIGSESKVYASPTFSLVICMAYIYIYGVKDFTTYNSYLQRPHLN